MSHSENFLYSVNTLLAYNINEHFYNGIHYVWCSPRFDQRGNPPSSNPKDIANSLNNDLQGSDRHSSKIEQNRTGLLKGVNAKHSAGIISDEKKDELLYIITNAEITHFKPLIYVIDKRAVQNNLIYVPASKKASLFSQEYLIEQLETHQFDIINLE